MIGPVFSFGYARWASAMIAVAPVSLYPQARQRKVWLLPAPLAVALGPTRIRRTSEGWLQRGQMRRTGIVAGGGIGPP